jgi:hypothetical protein
LFTNMPVHQERKNMDMKQRQIWTHGRPASKKPESEISDPLLIADVLLHLDQLLLAGTRLNLLLTVRHGGEGGRVDRRAHRLQC